MPTSLTELFSPACHLCPRRCGAARDEGVRGVCGANDTLRVARAALHMWEEPPISGEAGSGTIFFSGCSLKCIYCQNHEISTGNFGLEISPERLVEIMLELQDQGANNINLVTATHYAHLLPAAIAAARERGLDIPIVYNTSGYERASAVAAWVTWSMCGSPTLNMPMPGLRSRFLILRITRAWPCRAWHRWRARSSAAGESWWTRTGS